jgi:apolipoprotein N-acyltransferase
VKNDMTVESDLTNMAKKAGWGFSYLVTGISWVVIGAIGLVIAAMLAQSALVAIMFMGMFFLPIAAIWLVCEALTRAKKVITR